MRFKRVRSNIVLSIIFKLYHHPKNMTIKKESAFLGLDKYDTILIKLGYG